MDEQQIVRLMEQGHTIKETCYEDGSYFIYLDGELLDLDSETELAILAAIHQGLIVEATSHLPHVAYKLSAPDAPH